MEITSQADGSSPLATVGQIRKCLVCPLSLHSQSSTMSTRAQYRRSREKRANKRLEDYLDPTLFVAGENGLVREVDGGADLTLGVGGGGPGVGWGGMGWGEMRIMRGQSI
ncbi:hypothetical protein RHGRI_012020 [Rhododendron griersonianum]|uniref:Uncharacterized protein n=1 Tax=Rhododendron griersonianum TaxID=479676 RepID=A0AAV6KQ35_9ERIC|nr:hypothetical protein RHGRI_012020 [Rhododendron griersonianum]